MPCSIRKHGICMDVASKLEMHSVGENMQAACRWLDLELPAGLIADEHASCRTLLFNDRFHNEKTYMLRKSEGRKFCNWTPMSSAFDC